MKIAFNAIRVSGKAGSGFDTFIINFLNAFAKICPQEIVYRIYTLYPDHFVDVPKENIIQVKIPLLKSRNLSYKTRIYVQCKEINKSSKLIFLKPLYYFVGDYLRMLWTQFFFPFYARKYDIIISLTEYEAIPFFNNQIVIIHNTVPYLFPEFETKYRFYTYKLLPKVLKKVKKIVVVSKILKDELIKLFGIKEEKVSVIYEGIDLKIFNISKEEDVNNYKKQLDISGEYIVTVGHSSPMKNFLGTIKSFALVRQKYNINLVVVGHMQKKFKDYVVNLVKEFGIENNVYLLGHIEHHQLNLLYSGAKMFVFPTLHEGFGLPPLEAMACGCPVVVSDGGSLPEVVGDAGVYVNPYDVESIAEGILKVLNDENLRKELINKGFEQVKKFSWGKAAKEFLNILIEIEKEIRV
ncbi:MAG: glycosyltransferase family 1 protein [Endomicrobiia bacterium]